MTQNSFGRRNIDQRGGAVRGGMNRGGNFSGGSRPAGSRYEERWLDEWWNPVLKDAKLLAEMRLQRPEHYSMANVESEIHNQALAELLDRLNTHLTLPKKEIDTQDLIHLIVNLCQAMPRSCGSDKRFIHWNFCRFVSVACIKQRMNWQEDILDIAIRNIFELVVMGMHLQNQENIIESLRALSYLLNEKSIIQYTGNTTFSWNGLVKNFTWDGLVKTIVSLASEGFIPIHLQRVPIDEMEANDEYIDQKLKAAVIKARERNVNIRRFACICLGNLVSKSGESLLAHQKSVFRAVVHVFSFLARVLWTRRSGYPSTMTTVLKAMCNVVGEWPTAHTDYLPLLCATMRSLMLYGTHLDPKGSLAFSGGESESETTENYSDCGITCDRAAKLRMMVLNCLACIARADTKIFHDHWLQFLPHNMNDATRQRPFGGPSIITVVVHDPNAKVRLQALATLAAFFEKNNLCNVAGKLDEPNKLAFDSLSTRYARILHALHHALVFILRRETQTSVKVQALKTLNSLVLNTTYGKLSPGLLSIVVAAAFEMLQNPVQGNIKYSLWALLTAVFGTSQYDVAQEELKPFIAMNAPSEELIQRILQSSGDRTLRPKPLPLRPPLIPEPTEESSKPAPRRSLIQMLLEDAKNRRPEEPYPDARTVISKMARSYRIAVSSMWDHGMKDFLLFGFRAEDPNVVVETLKVAEKWIIPVSGQSHLVSSRAEAVYGLLEIAEARDLIATELVNISPKFTGMEQKCTTLRSRVLSVLSVLRVWHWQGFSKAQRKSFLDLAYNATFDESESVVTAGCRTLGVLVTFRLEFPNYYQLACQRLIHLLESADRSKQTPPRSKQTQIRASWALANICDLHVNVHHQHPEEPDPWIEGSIPGFDPSSDTNIRPCLVKLVSAGLIGRLIGTCFDITNKEQPKIIANVIRAVGNIGHWLPLRGQEGDDTSEQVWVGICTVLSREMSKERNTHKAKWNACYATGNVLSNPQMPRIKTPEAKRYTLELYRTLLEVLETSENYKVRINAVQALTAPPTRKHYGAIFGSLWLMLLSCIRNLQENGSVKKFVELKYQMVLTKKLAIAVFHMIDLCSPRDLKNAQVVSLLGHHTKVLALLLVERHRELWTNEQYLNNSTTDRKVSKAKQSLLFGTSPQDMTTDTVEQAHRKVKSLLSSLETPEGKLYLENYLLETQYFSDLEKKEGQLENSKTAAQEPVE